MWWRMMKTRILMVVSVLVSPGPGWNEICKGPCCDGVCALAVNPCRSSFSSSRSPCVAARVFNPFTTSILLGKKFFRRNQHHIFHVFQGDFALVFFVFLASAFGSRDTVICIAVCSGLMNRFSYTSTAAWCICWIAGVGRSRSRSGIVSQDRSGIMIL